MNKPEVLNYGRLDPADRAALDSYIEMARQVEDMSGPKSSFGGLVRSPEADRILKRVNDLTMSKPGMDGLYSSVDAFVEAIDGMSNEGSAI